MKLGYKYNITRWLSKRLASCKSWHL